MSEQRDMLCATAAAVFPEGLAAVESAGFATLLVTEADGGFGGDWGDLFALMRIAGATAPALPIGEVMISGRFGEISRAHGAFLRVGQAAGAMDAALAMSIDHVNTRQQFGKPLSKFQAVQQSLAILATEAAAVNVAGAAAAAALDGGEDALFEIAAAKLRTNRAIGIGTAIAHQVHGAIGFTQEYGLHHLTTALMRWRTEHGGDAYWAELLGGITAGLGGAGLWNEITRRGDRR